MIVNCIICSQDFDSNDSKLIHACTNNNYRLFINMEGYALDIEISKIDTIAGYGYFYGASHITIYDGPSIARSIFAENKYYTPAELLSIYNRLKNIKSFW